MSYPALTQPRTAEDWEAYREPISRMYEGKPLKEVIQIMKDTYCFKATIKQYKTQLKRWGIDTKRTSGPEYVTILRKKRQREEEVPGRLTVFTLHGRPVDSAKVEGFEKRHRTELEDMLLRAGSASFGGEDGERATARTPEDLDYRTPTPDPHFEAESNAGGPHQHDEDDHDHGGHAQGQLQRYCSPLRSRSQSPYAQSPSSLLPPYEAAALDLFVSNSPLAVASPNPTEFDWWDAFIDYGSNMSSPSPDNHASARYTIDSPIPLGVIGEIIKITPLVRVIFEICSAIRVVSLSLTAEVDLYRSNPSSASS